MNFVFVYLAPMNLQIERETIQWPEKCEKFHKLKRKIFNRSKNIENAEKSIENRKKIIKDFNVC
jgi:hypothetical protein